MQRPSSFLTLLPIAIAAVVAPQACGGDNSNDTGVLTASGGSTATFVGSPWIQPLRH